MIGIYNYTVILTYASLASAMVGTMLAANGHFVLAIICLALSGLCDMFDGKVARKKKDRTDDEKLFGVQIDSLCDTVAFGVFPAIFCYLFGMNNVIGIITVVYFCICGVARLAYFNVLETNRQQVEDGANKYYHGLPITASSIVLPIFFLLNFFIPRGLFLILLNVLMLAMGTMYIVDFKMRKPSNGMLVVFVVIVAVALIFTLICARFHFGFFHC